MALQPSGAISLDDIHQEAGGTTGTTASINDADIRALIGKASGVTMSFSEWYGASSSLLSSTVTVGTYSVPYVGTGYGFITSGSLYYNNSPAGSISPSSASGFLSGSSIVNSSWLFRTSTSSGYIILEAAGNHTNAGFTTYTVGSTGFARTSASYSYNSAVNATKWEWAYATNLFGTTNGATVGITIT